MKVVALEQTTMTVTELAELVKEGPVILTRDGQPVVSVKDLAASDWESVSLASHPEFTDSRSKNHAAPTVSREGRAWRTFVVNSAWKKRFVVEVQRAPRERSESDPRPMLLSACSIAQEGGFPASPIRSRTVSRNVR